MRTDRTADGRLRLLLDLAESRNLRPVATVLEESFNARTGQRFEDPLGDAAWIEYEIDGRSFTLNWDHWAGVGVISAHEDGGPTLERIRDYFEHHPLPPEPRHEHDVPGAADCRQGDRTSQTCTVNLMRFIAWGAIIGLALGIVEALVTAIGATAYWERVGIHFGQLGFAGPGLGAVAGYVVAKKIGRYSRRLQLTRHERGQCTSCGYDLTGNTSGICPECGETVPESTNDSERAGQLPRLEGTHGEHTIVCRLHRDSARSDHRLPAREVVADEPTWSELGRFPDAN